MLKSTTSLILGFLLMFWFYPSQFSKPSQRGISVMADSLPNAKKWPSEIEVSNFTTPAITPSPACLAVSPYGEVFVGVDKMGSLGKKPNEGSIIKLIDSDNDGKVDKHTVFALTDNPRGIIVNGDKVFVLHTMFSKETGEATGMDLVVFEDKNNDGVADGPSKPLIEHISNPNFIRSRGTDHATNGIRMGIDGWIYIAVGDFGFHDAVDRSGTKLTMLGGGIVRVRPDGTDMEVYTHGMRNIYDLAIDPYMNIFARGNTNDGGGWNIRFSHQIQTGEYGYPVLFKHFTEEIIPAMVDLGGGSGTGALFMDDANWPDKYNHVPMMADWGRNELFIHRVTENGASYTQKDESFIKLSQITDLDIDASGRLFLSAWDGAGYSGNPGKGFVVRAVPKNWVYKPFTDLKKASVKELAGLLQADGGVARLAAQQELLTRPAKQAASASWKIANDNKAPLYARTAAMYTYLQISGADAIPNITKLTSEPEMQEIALRALADRKGNFSKVSIAPFLKALESGSDRVKVAAMIGLGRLGDKKAISALLNVPVPNSFVAPDKGTEGPHATPNAAIIPAHIAVQALVRLQAFEECVTALETKNAKIALWALRYMHNPKAVDGLIDVYGKTSNKQLKLDILSTLSRLYKIEADYDGSWWWSTRPDTHGPYYKGVVWESSPKIKNILMTEFNKANDADKMFFADLNEKNRMDISEFGGEEQLAAKEEVKIDLNKIRNKKGQVGESSIEDVMLAMDKIQGDPAHGKKLFTMQGCVACHSIKKEETMKGPFMGQIGSIMTRQQIAESILKPDASISQGFASVLITAKGDKTYMGFITQESATKLVLRDIAGQVYNIKIADIISRKEMENSMMPAGLGNSLSYEEFASLITFLSQQKK